MAGEETSSNEGGGRVPEIRKDAVLNRWVIFSQARSRRPSDFKSESNPKPGPYSENCPFCLGNEHLCAPEIFRVQPSDSSDWKIRVIQNLYPAVSRDELGRRGRVQEQEEASSGNGNKKVSGFGFHDVVIEAPLHSVELLDLSPAEVGDVLLAYKKRIHQLLSYHSIQYVQVFKNHGASAGASLSHSHSQIIALPVVPTAVSARIDCMKQYFEQTGKCKLCEVPVEDLLIDESAHFISIAPFASTFPFEIWIIPRDHSSHFYELDNGKAPEKVYLQYLLILKARMLGSLTLNRGILLNWACKLLQYMHEKCIGNTFATGIKVEDDLHLNAIDLGGLLKLLLRKISLQLNNPPYNMMIHTTPFHLNLSCLPYTHWFLQIVPQLTIVGGFEVGTGCYINPIFPEDAAKVLREVQLSG